MKTNFTPRPLARKLLILIVVFSLAVTLITTAGQLYREFRTDIEMVGERLEQIETSYSESLSTSAWALDAVRLKSDVEGIQRLPDIEYAVIVVTGLAPIESGVRPKENPIERTLKLVYQYENKKYEIGELLLIASSNGARERLKDRIFITLTTNAVNTFFIAIFIYLLFRLLVTQPLGSLTNFASRLRADNLDTPLVLSRTKFGSGGEDEIDELAQAMEDMRSNLISATRANLVSEARFRDFAEMGSDWMWETDADQRFIFFSDQADRVVGLGAETLLGTSIEEFNEKYLSEGEKKNVDKHRDHAEALKNRESYSRHRVQWDLGNGVLKTFDLSGTPKFDEMGEYQGYRGTGTDVTAEVEAQIAHERFLFALENLTEGIALWDEDDVFVLCNDFYRELAGPAAIELVPGVKFEAWLSSQFRHGITPDNVDTPRDWYEKRLAYHRNPVGTMEAMRDGNWYRIQEQKLRDGSTVQTVIDIQELKTNEERLRRAQHFESLGQLTGGVAHEFNNLLMVIAGNLEFIEDAVKTLDEGNKQALRSAWKATMRGADTTRRLLAFSRKQSLAPSLLEVDARLAESCSVLGRTLGETHPVIADADTDLWTVYADSGQLDASLLNLALNARDAMPDGGEITIGASNYSLEVEEAEQFEVEPGDYVEVYVRDSGHGMSDETREHAFEPFYTTKGVGKGTGLGLSMVYGYAKQSDGFAKISSRPAEGTTVSLFLPRASRDSERPVSRILEKSDRRLYAGGTETILVVEDDEDVRQTVVHGLTTLGYRVLEAEDGAAGERIMDGGQHIDLIFSDVVMPGNVSGFDLARKAIDRKNDVKVLLTSGYNEDAYEDDTVKLGKVRLIQKPYSKRELSLMLREIFDQEAPGQV